MSQETTSIEQEMKALTESTMKEEVTTSKFNTQEAIMLGNDDSVFSGTAKDGSEVVIISTRSRLLVDGVLEDIAVKGLGPTLEAAKADHAKALAYATSDKVKTIDVYTNGSRKLSFTTFGIFVPRTAEPSLVDRRATAAQTAAPASL